jgi:hypothetical protein
MREAQHKHGFGEQLQQCDVLSCIRLPGSLGSVVYLKPYCICGALALLEHAGTAASELPRALRRDRCFEAVLGARVKQSTMQHKQCTQ